MYTYCILVFLRILKQLIIQKYTYSIIIHKELIYMSEIVNYSVKIDIEQRDLLQKKIAESELTAGNFLSTMLTSYEAAQSRESLSDIRELNQVQNHLARIEEIYIGLAKSRKDSEESHDHSIADLKEQLGVIKAQLVDTQSTTKVKVKAISIQMEELIEKTAKENKKNILELADLKEQKEMAEEGQRQSVKIANLTEQTLTRVQEQIAELKKTATLNQQRAEQAVNVLDLKTIELNTTVQEQVALRKQMERERENSKRSFEYQQHSSELDKQKSILLAQQDSLAKRESLQDEIVKLRDQLATERERIAQILLANIPMTD